MSHSIDNGGPAFPNITPEMNIQGGPGMTLRDWFATHAPEPTQAYMDTQYRLDHGRNPHNDSYKPRRREELEIRAQYRFAYADAMIAARKIGGAA